MQSSLPTTWPELHHYARKMDEADPLKRFRKQFRIPVSAEGAEEIYFLGNSLGLQPVRTASAIQQILQDWADWGVEGFFNGRQPWLQFHDRLIQPLARIVGALPQEMVVMNQLTVNLHLMLVSFYRPTAVRYKIVCERPAFSSDLYMLQTHIRHLGFSPEETLLFVNPREGEQHLRTADIVHTIEQNAPAIALVLLGGVNYYTVQCLAMPAIT
ncbi:MAG: kynureninase, partial [Chitinophagaceae bacterium]